MKTTLATLAAVLATAVLAPLPSSAAPSMADQGRTAGQPALHASDKAVPAKDVKGVQTMTVTVAGGKYTPSVIEVKKGKPVQLTFKGGKDMGCGSTIVFKSLKQKHTVATGKTVTFKFTPKEPGVIVFTCPMGMYKGSVNVK